MKKVFLLLLAISTSLDIIAKSEIMMDKQEDDGHRYLATNSESIYSKWSSAGSLSLLVDAYGIDTTYSICLTLNEGKIQIDKDRILLLKLKSGEIIELKNSNKIGPADYEPVTSNYGSWVLVRPVYQISKEQLDKIMSNDVIKIRIETDTEEIDRDIKYKTLSLAVKNLYKDIKKQLAKKKDKYSDF